MVSSQNVTQNFTNAGVLNALTLNTGGILDTNVGTDTINAGSLTSSANAQFEIHVTGTSSTVLNLNAFLLGNTSGLVKADGGTLNLGNQEYYAGPTTVNGGALVLSGLGPDPPRCSHGDRGDAPEPHRQWRHAQPERRRSGGGPAWDLEQHLRAWRHWRQQRSQTPARPSP